MVGGFEMGLDTYKRIKSPLTLDFIRLSSNCPAWV